MCPPSYPTKCDRNGRSGRMQEGAPAVSIEHVGVSAAGVRRSPVRGRQQKHPRSLVRQQGCRKGKGCGLGGANPVSLVTADKKLSWLTI